MLSWKLPEVKQGSKVERDVVVLRLMAFVVALTLIIIGSFYNFDGLSGRSPYDHGIQAPIFALASVLAFASRFPVGSETPILSLTSIVMHVLGLTATTLSALAWFRHVTEGDPSTLLIVIVAPVFGGSVAVTVVYSIIRYIKGWD